MRFSVFFCAGRPTALLWDKTPQNQHARASATNLDSRFRGNDGRRNEGRRGALQAQHSHLLLTKIEIMSGDAIDLIEYIFR